MSEKQTDTNPHSAVNRAIDELRRQGSVIIRENGRTFAVLPGESLDAKMLALAPSSDRALIITAARAKAAGLQATSDTHIKADSLSLAQLQYLADPLAAKIPLPELSISAAPEQYRLALRLAKYASLLPALLIIENITGTNDWPVVTTQDIKNYIAQPLLAIVSTASANLPLAGAENATITSFRIPHSASVHLAITIGTIKPGDTPLTRIHSSCVTGDILGSLRCDCGDQLQKALQEIITAGSGILLYLHQEGRGIGITNKLRAYALQEQGYDTYDANLMLGFDEDERDFSIAAAMLKKLSVTRVRLLTNNPTKIENLKKHGIDIIERVPLVAKSGRHNHAYLDAKAKKSGHLF